MGERWIKEAEDLTAVGTSGPMDGGKPRVTLHVTVSKPGSFDAMHGVLTRAKAEPHLLYDPATDRLGQYFPLDRSARALRNDGTRRTNGHGSVNIQIEVCAMPTPGFTVGWTPGPNWRAMLRAIRSWGVPDVWPAGRLSRSGSDNVDRSWASYSKAGWFGHCNVPGNDHWDPGPIDQRAVFALEEDDMSTAADEVKDYVRALLLDGYTSGGEDKPSILRVLTETQRRVTVQGAQITALSAAVQALAEAKDADSDAILAAVERAAHDALADVSITLTTKE